MKKLMLLLVVLLAVPMLLMGGSPKPAEKEAEKPVVEMAEEEMSDENLDQIDPWIVKKREGLDEVRIPIAEGYLGPNGEPVTSDADVFLTRREVKQIQQGKPNGKPYTLVIAWHSLAGMTEYGAAWQKGIYDTCKYLGIKIIGETDGEYNPEKQRSDVETLVALKPDLMISAPIDLGTAASVFKPAVDAGIKLSIVSNPGKLVHGKDFIGCTSYDPYAVGIYQAQAIADTFGENARIGFIYWDGLYWPANYQEKIMRETLAKLHPSIKIVEDIGFLDVKDAGDIAAAMILRTPDLDGFFVSWMDPGQYVITAIKESGKHYEIVSNSINRIAMISMATDGILAETVTDLPYQIGINCALVAAYGAIGKPGPNFAVSPIIRITKENIRDGWTMSTDLPIPIEVEEVLVKQGL